MNRILLLLLLLVCLAAPSFALKQGELFPPLPATTLEGKAINIGQLQPPMILTVGTTWCPSCGNLRRELDKIRPFLKENGIQYVEIFLGESPDKVKKYLESIHLAHPDVVLLDSKVIGRALRVRMIPRVILVDKEFRVYKDTPPFSGAALQRELSQMLDEH